MPIAFHMLLLPLELPFSFITSSPYLQMSAVQYFSQFNIPVFCAPAARLCESVEGLCAPAGAHKPSTLSHKRLACEPGLVKKLLLGGLDSYSIVMLSAAKHLVARRVRPFAALRVTGIIFIFLDLSLYGTTMSRFCSLLHNNVLFETNIDAMSIVVLRAVKKDVFEWSSSQNCILKL